MGVAWSPDGSAVATAGQDGKARIWDPATGAELRALDGGAQWVEHVAWSPDGRYLATAAGKVLRVWAADGGGPMYEFRGHRSTIAAMQWHRNKNEIATACYGSLLLFNVESGNGAGEPYEALEWSSSLISLTWSPDGRYVGAGTQEASLVMWRLQEQPKPGKGGSSKEEDAGIEFQMTGYESKVKELAWDRTGRFLATGGGQRVTIWDFAGAGPEGTTPQVLRHLFRVTQLAYQRAGDVLVSGSREGHLVFWRPESSSVPLHEVKLSADIVLARWSPDDSAVAACTSDGRLWVVDAPASPR